MREGGLRAEGEGELGGVDLVVVDNAGTGRDDEGEHVGMILGLVTGDARVVVLTSSIRSDGSD